MIGELKDKLDELLREGDDCPRLYRLVEFYYDHVIKEMFGHKENGERIYSPEEYDRPVEERETGIGEAISILLGKGHDINEADGGFNSLMIVVGYTDPRMAEYMIAHGADCRKVPDNLMDEEEDPAGPKTNWYLDEIDIDLLDADSERNVKDIEKYKDNLISMAKILANAGNLCPYGGTVLDIDEDNIIVHPPRNRY